MAERIKYMRRRKVKGGTAFYFEVPSHIWQEGMPFSRSTALGRDEYLAQEKASSLNTKLREWRKTGQEPKDRKTIAYIWEHYTKHRLYTDLAPATRSSYDYIRKLFDRNQNGGKLLSEIPLDAFDANAAENLYHYLEERHKERLSQQIMDMLRFLFQFGKARLDTPAFSGDNPFANLRIRRSPPKKRTIRHEHIYAIIDTARKLGEEDIALAVELNYWIAQRPEDVIALRKSSITQNNDGYHFFTIVQKKVERFDPPPINLPIPPHLLPAIMAKEDYIILNSIGRPFRRPHFEKKFKAVCAVAGLEKFNYQFHLVRNSALSRYVAAGATGAATLGISGHTSEKMLNRVYVGNTEEKSLYAFKKRYESEVGISTPTRKPLNPDGLN
jgi:hypothetical protein